MPGWWCDPRQGLWGPNWLCPALGQQPGPAGTAVPPRGTTELLWGHPKSRTSSTGGYFRTCESVTTIFWFRFQPRVAYASSFPQKTEDLWDPSPRAAYPQPGPDPAAAPALSLVKRHEVPLGPCSSLSKSMWMASHPWDVSLHPASLLRLHLMPSSMSLIKVLNEIIN